MTALVKFEEFVEALGTELHDLDNDVLKIMLTNTAPDEETDAVFTDMTDIAAGNGYTAGGSTVGSTAYSQTDGVATLTGDDVTFTATGAIGPFRYAVLYNDTSATKPLICYWDYGSSISLADTNLFVIDFADSVIMTVE